MNPSSLKRVVAFLSDPRVPKLPRFAVVAAVLYLISPIDLVPELVFPVVGWMDDAVMIWLALRWLVKEGDKATEPTELPPTAKRLP